ncbi:MAG: hypothetical protein ACYDHP_04745 [Ferrimicrobium sp.]
MAVVEEQCLDSRLPVFRATRAGDDEVATIVASLGCVPTGSGAPSASVIAEFAERLSSLTGLEVVAFTPRGTGQVPGTLSWRSLVEDVISVVDLAGKGSVILAGFGVVGAAMVAVAAITPTITGVATIDGWAVPSESVRDWLLGYGVRLDEDAFVGEDLLKWESQSWMAVARSVEVPWLLVVPSLAYESERLYYDTVVAVAARAELHRVGAVGDRLQDDPRSYAILLGWLERSVHSGRGGDVGAGITEA